MENKVFEKNITTISQYNKKLVDKLLMFENKKSNLAIIETQENEYSLVFNGISLHSTDGVCKEAKNIVSKIQDKPNTLRLIYGLGLGYLVDEMANVFTNSTIIVYEPNIDILKFVLSSVSIDAIYKENVIICNDEDDLYFQIAKNTDTTTNMTISFLPSYNTLFHDDIMETLKLAQKAQGEHFANKNTFLKKAPAALDNTFKNLKNIFSNPNISDLKDIYKGKTALCLSSGPSLKENIEIIKENQDKFIIFAVNNSIKLLQQNNVKPDFIVNIETFNSSGQFSTINTQDYYFILEGFCSNEVSSFKTKKTFNYISNRIFMNPWIRNCLKLTDDIETIGTVSYTAFMSAVVMGCDKIILCGQDLAYKDGNCYAKGSQFEQLECVYDKNTKSYKIQAKDLNAYIESIRTPQYNDEEMKERALWYIKFLNDNLYTVKSQDGKDVPSQCGYALFIEQFKNAAKTLRKTMPHIELINSSTGGAQINGFENIALKDIVKNLTPIKKLDLTNYEANIDVTHIQKEIETLETELKNYKQNIENFILVNNKILKEIEIKKVHTPNLIKLLQKHKDILAKITQAANTKYFNFIIMTHFYKILDCANANYIEDLNILRDTIKMYNNSYTEAREQTNSILKCLCDYKSVIK